MSILSESKQAWSEKAKDTGCFEVKRDKLEGLIDGVCDSNRRPDYWVMLSIDLDSINWWTLERRTLGSSGLR
jgi:hypothetical protein